MYTAHQENNTGKVKDMAQQLRVLVAESGGAEFGSQQPWDKAVYCPYL